MSLIFQATKTEDGTCAYACRKAEESRCTCVCGGVNHGIACQARLDQESE